MTLALQWVVLWCLGFLCFGSFSVVGEVKAECFVSCPFFFFFFVSFLTYTSILGFTLPCLVSSTVMETKVRLGY
jgi:hypothetical protein